MLVNAPYAIINRVFQFFTNASMIAAYQAYCINYKAIMEYLENSRKSDDRFNVYEKVCTSDSRCNRLQLEDLLISPLQRITRLPIYMKEILKFTETEKEKELLTEIMEKVEETLQTIDESIQWLFNFERLQELQKQLIWPPVTELDPKCYIPETLKLTVSRQFCETLIAHPRRRLIHEGLLSYIGLDSVSADLTAVIFTKNILENQKSTEVYLFLFNDMLLVTRIKKSNMLTKVNKPSQDLRITNMYKFIVCRQPIPLDSCVFCDIGPVQINGDNNLKNSFAILHLTRFYQLIALYTLQAPTKESKETWIQKFQESVDNYELIQLRDILHCTHLLHSQDAS
ncbi:unnamed protein product [Soboliphyme baturini]|uniref:DH domain-containing protein n=1 Tax=Soboliphyme baturini TaxID=241478 RepID=A0A183J6W3_9BILA|nr:unnamed protein product [Soboliphyme baturini]